jgi:hypothetical protein
LDESSTKFVSRHAVQESYVVLPGGKTDFTTHSRDESHAFLNFQTHKTSGDGRGWVDELSIPHFSTNTTTYIAITPVREGNSGKRRTASRKYTSLYSFSFISQVIIGI